jgi:voltage-gated potassium channel
MSRLTGSTPWIGPYHADIPVLVGDTANPQHPSAAGLVPVVSRTVTAPISWSECMLSGRRQWSTRSTRFGEHLWLALNAPACYQLLTSLKAGPGADGPERGLA